MKVLLLITPFLEPHRPPSSAAIIYETAKLAGIKDIDIIDINIELYRRLGPAKFNDVQMDYTYYGNRRYDGFINLLQEILPKDDNYDLIMISAFSFYSQSITIELCEYLRKHYKSKILLGGPAVQYPMVTNKPAYNQDDKITFGDTIQQKGLIDDYISGEGEIALHEYLKGNMEYPGINNNDFVQIDDLNNIPLPNYDGLDLTKYDYLTDGFDFFIYGSRGCVRKCTFCDIHTYWPKYKYRSGESIASEMIMYYEKYGTKNFYFSDSLFNGSIKSFTDYLNKLSKYPVAKNFRWGGYAIIRPKNQHPPEMYDMIAETGKSFWVTGTESFVDRVRLEMLKKFTNDDMLYHLEQSARIGLENTLLMIPTWPSETAQEHEEYLSWFPKLKKYVANGAIAGVSVSPRLIALSKTALGRDPNLMYKDEEISKTGVTREFYWFNKENPELNMKERVRRTYMIFKTARENRFPIHRMEQRLNDLLFVVDTLKKHPNLEYNSDDLNIMRSDIIKLQED